MIPIVIIYPGSPPHPDEDHTSGLRVSGGLTQYHTTPHHTTTQLSTAHHTGRVVEVHMSSQVEHINLQVEAVDTHRPRTNTPTYKVTCTCTCTCTCRGCA